MNKIGQQLSAWAFVSLAVLGTSFMNLTQIHAAEPEKLANITDDISFDGGYVYVAQYVVMNKNAQLPYLTFSYNLTAVAGGTYTDENGKTTVVYAGDDANRVSLYEGKTLDNIVSKAYLSYSNTTYTADSPVTLGENQVYVKTTFSLSFYGNISYKEPGIYRYLLSQKEISDQYSTVFDKTGTTPLTYGGDRYVDVYVDSYEGAEKDTLAVTKCVVRSANDMTDASKSKGLVSTYNTHDLTFNNTVSGNQSRTDDVFSYDSILTIPYNGARMTIKSNDTNNPSYLKTTYNSGTKKYSTTATLKVQANTSFTIYGIPDNCGYQILQTNKEVKPLGYTPEFVTAKSSGDLGWLYDPVFSGDANNYKTAQATRWLDYATWDDALTADTTLTVNYRKSGVVPTGIIVSVTPYASLALAGLIGMIAFAKRKKSSEE